MKYLVVLSSCFFLLLTSARNLREELIANVLNEVEHDSGKKLVDTKEDAITNTNKEVTAVSAGNDKRGALATFFLINGAFSGAFDIYKYERGCEDFKNYRSNLNELERLDGVLSDLQDEINDLWVPFEELLRYYERLEDYTSSIDTILEHYDELTEAIFIVIDPTLQSKLEETEAALLTEIEFQNGTEVPDFSYLEESFLSSFDLAISIVKNFRSLAWLVGTKIYEGISSLWSSSEAANLVTENPSRFETFLSYASDLKAKVSGWYNSAKEYYELKISEFKEYLEGQIDEFFEAHPSVQSAWEYVAGEGAAAEGWLTFTTRIRTAAKGLVMAGFIGYDIYLAVDFVNECQDRVDNAAELITEMEEREAQLIEIRDEVLENYANLSVAYTELQQQFRNTTFIAYINTIKEIQENETDKTPEQELAVTELQTYIDGIQDAEPNATDQLILTLLDGLTHVNLHMDCLYEKAKIIRGAYVDCAYGYDTFENIWANISETQLSEAEECYSTGNLTEDDLMTSITYELELNNKSTICLRNNVDIFSLACSYYHDDVDSATISVRLGVTLDDVEYFISLCPAASFTDLEKEVVCIKKEEGKDLDTVEEYFPYHDQTTLSTIYDNCSLSATQVENICYSKTSGYSVSFIETNYPLYPSSLIQEAYDSCEKPAPSAYYENVICTLKSEDIDLDTEFFIYLKTIYDEDAVDEVYNNC